MSKLIKRKQIDLKLKAAPDGSYGFSSNIPNVLQGDDLESAIDKIVSVLDKLSPVMPPLLNQLTLSISVAGGTTTPTTGLLTSDGTTKTNVHKFVNNSTLTWTTTGIFNSVSTRNGHFRNGDSTTAKLRITHLYNSIKGAILATMATTQNDSDILERTIMIEYSENGSFSDTIYLTGTYRIESASTPTASINSVTIPSMSGQKVSGVPTLNNGQIISISANISNGIKYYYPSIIASSTVTSASTLSVTISGSQTPNSTYNYVRNHTISGSVTVESITSSVTPNDIFGSGSAILSTDTSKRIDTVGVAKITTDTSIRKLSPVTGGQYETISGTYGLVQHDNTLNSVSDAYSYQLQVYGNNYRYPSGNFTAFGGPNYTSLTQNSWRYSDFSVTSISNKTNIDLTIVGATGITVNPYGTANFRLYVKIEGVTGWLDANAAWAAGTPISDGDASVDVGNSTSATVRRITFGANRTGNISVRVGINSGSAITFSGITIA